MKTSYIKNKVTVKIKNKFGEKYDYSALEYKSSKDNIKIICPIHGQFETNSGKYFRGSACKSCEELNVWEFFKSYANNNHNNKYIYLKPTTFSNISKDTIEVICPIHGKHKQTARQHLIGAGCYKCGKTNLKDTEEFIKRAKEKFFGKFNYTLVDYKGINSNIEIICPVHGKFETTPGAHLYSKFGCKKCANTNQSLIQTSLNIIDYLKKGSEIHNNKYEYSLVEFISKKRKVKVICPKHGVWETNLANHIDKKSGCPKCKGEKLHKDRALTTEQYIERAKLKHGDKYDYSLVNYINSKTKIKIICPIHGEYKVFPSAHLKGECRKCFENKT